LSESLEGVVTDLFDELEDEFWWCNGDRY